MSDKTRKILVCLTFIALAVILSSPFAYCDEVSRVNAAFKKNYRSGDSVHISKTRIARSWALLDYSAKYKSGDLLRGVALMQKKKGKWVLNSYASRGVTGDFLRGAGIPPTAWSKLVDSSWIQKTKPIIAAMHRKYSKKYIISSVRIVKNWVACDWSLIEGNEVAAEGMAILVYKNGRWLIKESGGGAMDVNLLRKIGVPAGVARKLLQN